MANGWTEERRRRQRELIKNWKPWEKSTGAKTAQGKAKSSRNAYKHGFTEVRLLMKILNRLLRMEEELLFK